MLDGNNSHLQKIKIKTRDNN